MPCYEITRVGLVFEGGDREALAEALKEAGFFGHSAAWERCLTAADKIIRDGEVSLEDTAWSREHWAKTKRLYTEKVIGKAAKRFGWMTTKAGGNKLTLRRR